MSGEGMPFNYSLWLDRLRKKAIADVRRLDGLTSAVFDRGGDEVDRLDAMLASAISLTQGFREAREIAMKALRARKLITQADALGIPREEITGLVAVYRQLVELLVSLLYPRMDAGHLEEYGGAGGAGGVSREDREENSGSGEKR